MQDVTHPQQQRMGHAQHQQHQHPSHIRPGGHPGRGGALGHQGEAGTEQDREQDPELARHKHVQAPGQRMVQALQAGQQAAVELLPGAGEPGQVDQEDPEQGPRPQRIQQSDPLACGRRPERHLLPVHGRLRIRITWCGRCCPAHPPRRATGGQAGVSAGGRRRRARGRARFQPHRPRALQRSPARTSGPCRPSDGSGPRPPRSCPPSAR